MVLEPSAVFDLIGNLGGNSFGGRAVNERRSYLELGADQFDPSITLVDDPLVVGLGYDAEGTPRARLPLVDGGRTVGVTHDRRTAAEAGTTSTGHLGMDVALRTHRPSPRAGRVGPRGGRRRGRRPCL